MSLATASLERRLRETFIAWVTILTVGAGWALWVGDADGSHLVTNLPWVRDHHALLEWSTNYIMDGFYVIFLGLLAYSWRTRRPRLKTVALGYLLAQLLGSILLVRVLKISLGRARPDEGALAGQWFGPSSHSAFHSFPSGHTTDLFTSAIFLALLLPPRGLRLAGLGIAIYIGFTRLALAQHFPSDVMAGALIGGSVSFLVAYYWVLPRERVLDDATPQPNLASRAE